jgi:hypothetical protein
MTIFVVTVALLAASAMAETADGSDAGTLRGVEVTTPLEALGGRVVLMLPAEARDEARQSAVMAAPESADSESRFIVDVQKARLVVMVWELFALAPDDLVAGAKAELGAEASAHEIGAVTVADGSVRAVRARPTQPELAADAAMVDSAYLALADGTAISVAVYVNATAFADLATARKLAEKIITSAKGGPRPLKRHAGPRTLGRLTMTVPDDVVLSVQPGPDFEVFLLRKLRRLGAPPPSTIGVYVGNQPEYIHRNVEYRDVTTSKIKGRLIGRDIEWTSWTTPEGMPTQEVIAEAVLSEAAKMVHVFINGQDAASVETMRRAAESLEVVQPL